MKNISFAASSSDVEKVIPYPKPAKQYIPEWYKRFQPFYDNDGNYTNKIKFGNSSEPLITAKSCIPFLDTYLSGYIQETWCDINIENNGSDIMYNFSYGDSDSLEIIGTRDIKHIPKEMIPHGYFDKGLFHWGRYWNPILPKGYSALITHPFNREDLPFRTVSGIIDSDDYFISGRVGFFMRNDFSGIIPKGTPMYQIIPFKRESWKTDIVKFVDTKDDMDMQFYKVRSVFSGGYKKLFWKRKDFN